MREIVKEAASRADVVLTWSERGWTALRIVFPSAASLIMAYFAHLESLPTYQIFGLVILTAFIVMAIMNLFKDLMIKSAIMRGELHWRTVPYDKSVLATQRFILIDAVIDKCTLRIRESDNQWSAFFESRERVDFYEFLCSEEFFIQHALRAMAGYEPEYILRDLIAESPIRPTDGEDAIQNEFAKLRFRQAHRDYTVINKYLTNIVKKANSEKPLLRDTIENGVKELFSKSK